MKKLSATYCLDRGLEPRSHSAGQARYAKARHGCTPTNLRCSRPYVSQRRGDVAKLHSSGEEWRLRVGEFRIRFRRDPTERSVIVLRVLPRSQAYRS
ncbi:MAG: hypothetical protein FJ316_00750 [SAR202 cluster bacterium]|nr:hypothetical protein [SAR202 cluster bacterium]